MTHLSLEDVNRLMADPSAEIRADTAARIVSQLDEGGLSEDGRRIALEIVRAMARDAAVLVRKALSLSLRRSDTLPRDVARALASDMEEVALPVLEVSSMLTEEDLIEIIRAGTVAKQKAVARREDVTDRVAGALVDTGNVEVVETLVANPRAEVGDATFGRIVDRFGDHASIQEALVERPRLPITIAERLVSLVSDNLRDRLLANQDLPPEVVGELVLESRERATVRLLGAATDPEDVQRLVRQLHHKGRLTASLILRAVCVGDVHFVEAALARLANIPLPNARLLVHDAGRQGLRAIYERAGLPARFYPAIRIALDIVQDTALDGGDRDRERFRRKVIERILTLVEDLEPEDIEYLLRKLNSAE